MGSRIMHLITANLVAKEIAIQEENEFLLGSVIPDSVMPKDRSHFFEYDDEGNTIAVNYIKFTGKYKDVLHCSITEGYLCHLITDHFWLNDFYLPWIKAEIKEDSSFVEAYHRDFRRLNHHLLKDFGDYDLKKKLGKASYVKPFDEIDGHSVKLFLKSMEADFDKGSPANNERLEVFQYSDIVRYIMKSKDNTVKFLNREKYSMEEYR